MNGSARSVGLNFQERVEEEHQNKKRGNGDDSARLCAFNLLNARAYSGNQWFFLNFEKL